MEVYLVWAQCGEIRTVLHALADKGVAERLVERAERHEYDDAGDPRPSACEILEVQLSIETLQVKE